MKSDFFVCFLATCENTILPLDGSKNIWTGIMKRKNRMTC